jgi:hypothetical protein
MFTIYSTVELESLLVSRYCHHSIISVMGNNISTRLARRTAA